MIFLRLKNTFVCTFLCFLLTFLLCSCENTITTYADELTSCSWSATLENEAELALDFTDDNATLKADFPDGEELCLSGFCELYDSTFVIHDTKTKYQYKFDYIVHFDRVELIYDNNTVSLYKRE